MSGERIQRRLAAILAADVVGYSRLMGMDEAGTVVRIKALVGEVIGPALARHSGRIVKLMGDGVLAEFGSAVDAVTCALEIQKLVPEHDSASPQDRSLRLRIGINVGDVIVDGDDIYGDGVNVAARLESLAEPGGIYISRSAADQVRDKVPVTIESRGEQAVKNIARPIEIFSLVVGGDAGMRVAVNLAPAAPPARAAAPAPRASDGPSVAVLAFSNMSGDPEQEYFSDGISEDIITDLAKIAGIHVIARNSSFAYKGKSVPIPEIAAALGVRYVLEGSVRKAGNRVRVTAQLIDAATGGHVWAERFDRDLVDIFEVQDELTQNIVGALHVKLSAAEGERPATRRAANVEAYTLFLRGREQVWLHTQTGNQQARALLSQAAALDPGYAAAYALTSFAWVNDYVNGWADDPRRALEEGIALAEKSAALDPDEPEAYFALGVAFLWSRDLDQALAYIDRGLELKPNGPPMLLLKSHVEIFSGRPAKALELIADTMKLDPLYPEIALHFLAEARFSLGEFEAAVDAIETRLKRNPNSVTAHALLASSLGHLGRLDEGRRAWDRVVQIDPGFSLERRRRVLPFRDPGGFDSRLEGLRRLGLEVG